MTHPTFQRLNRDQVAPVTSRPAPEKVLAGDPVFTSWDIEEREGVYAGLWQCTPGVVSLSYTEWEYCRILAGHSILTDEAGNRHDLRPGDSFVIRPGFRGTWEVVETTLKDYVIRT